jgi:alpha-tubulin suppressor-like RCC1 family protein
VNARPLLPLLPFAWLCLAVTVWAAPITYPNHVYVFSGGTFSPVAEMSNVKAVAVEDDMILAVTQDGRVIASGLPENWVPQGLLEQLTNVVAVGLNYTMAAALTADGRLHEFGRDGVLITPQLNNVIAMDVAGQAHDDDLDYKLAVLGDGQVLVWGYFGFPPSAVVPGIVTAAGGWTHIVGLMNDGTVVEWGHGRETPQTVAGLSDVIAVAAGGMHSLALRADGTVAAWGENNFGQLNIPAGLSNVVAIAASEYHSLALKSDGTLAAWGQDFFGGSVTPPANLSNVMAIAASGTRNVAITSLPFSARTPIHYPNQAYIFSDGAFAPVPGFTNIKAFAVEGDNVLAVTREGRVIGLGGAPVGAVTNAVAVELSYVQSAALTADGRVIEFDTDYPQPPGLTNVVAFDVFGQFNDDDLDTKLAVTRDGQVVVWGRFGHPLSAEIPGVITAVGGWSHIVALKSDGTVVEWDTETEPAAVPGLSNVVAIAAGGSHSVALKADGTVTAWGENFVGQLNVPAGLSNVIAITASEDHSLALKSDGTMAAWGRAYFGGTVTPPATLTNVIAIASSGTRNLALVRFPPASPTLAIAAGAQAGRLTIALSGEANRAYAIESSADLLTWHFLQNVTNHTGLLSFNVGITNGSARFFRARLL